MMKPVELLQYHLDRLDRFDEIDWRYTIRQWTYDILGVVPADVDNLTDKQQVGILALEKIFYQSQGSFRERLVNDARQASDAAKSRIR